MRRESTGASLSLRCSSYCSRPLPESQGGGGRGLVNGIHPEVAVGVTNPAQGLCGHWRAPPRGLGAGGGGLRGPGRAACRGVGLLWSGLGRAQGLLCLLDVSKG